MASSMGLRWESDRNEIVRTINLYRAFLYNKFPQFALFDDAFACVEICKFPTQCGDPCDCSDDSFWGASLPPHFAGVTAAWRYHTPVRLHSRWQEAHTGMVNQKNTACGVFPWEPNSVTFRPLKTASVLSLYARSKEDDGKTVYMSVRDENGSQQRLSLRLDGDGVVHTPITVKNIDSVVLPERDGEVTLSQEDGYELSIYAPHETTPSYSRIKIDLDDSCDCNGGTLLIKGARKFAPIGFDTDIVEVGDPIILDLAATYFRYWKSKEADEKNAADRALADMLGNLDGNLQRNRGNMRQDFAWRPKINRRNQLR